MDGGPVDKYLLWVNGEAVGAYETREEAENAAKPHLSKAQLQIRTSSASNSMAPSRIWNYKPDRKQWFEKMNG